MSEFVIFQLTFASKTFPTKSTSEWKIACMFEHVILQMAVGCVCCIAHIALVEFLTVTWLMEKCSLDIQTVNYFAVYFFIFLL